MPVGVHTLKDAMSVKAEKPKPYIILDRNEYQCSSKEMC